MSGLNPFRRRRSEDVAGHHPSPSSADRNFTSSETLRAAALVSNDPRMPNGLAEPPHVADADDSSSSDDQSVTNPFNHGSYLGDHDVEDRDDRDLDEETRSASHGTPHDAPPRESARTMRKDGESYPVNSEHPGRDVVLPDMMTVAKSDVLVHSLPAPYTGSHPGSHTGSHTASSSSTDVSQQSTHTGVAGRPEVERITSDMERESQVLAHHAGNKDRRPPAPPRSHHGKLIRSSPAVTSTVHRQTPSNSTNRLSFHGSSTEISLGQPDKLTQPRKPSQPSVNPGGFGESRPTWPTELTRSQSNYKRPPTPPLSRRQSQMRRSRTTYSKPNPSQGRETSGTMEENSLAGIDRGAISAPQRESGCNTPQSDEARLRPSSSHDDSTDSAGAGIPRAEPANAAPLSRMGSMKSTKRVSYTGSQTPSAVPPPPPPRRTRVSSNNSNDSNRPRVLPMEKEARNEGDFTPHPSNASDILADLTRLQKEVDDLRGHYESRKVSQ